MIHAEVAERAGARIEDMPFMFVAPEPGNEKAVGHGLSFLLHGVTNLLGFPGTIPPAVPRRRSEDPTDPDRGSNGVLDFLSGAEGLVQLVGAKVYTEPDPAVAAQTIHTHLDRKRTELGWPDPLRAWGIQADRTILPEFQI